MVLSNRLQAIAAFIRSGSRMSDVGTDHGYLPLWLAENGVCASIIASDIRTGPLKTAMRNAALAGLGEAIDFRLCAGLEGYAPDETDTIVIAGMGGETIMAILSAAPWAREKTLILQPQTKQPRLRVWLSENGYAVEDAALVYDTGRIYVIWKCAAGEKRELAAYERYVDRTLVQKCDALLPAYIDGVIKTLLHKRQGLSRAASADGEELRRCGEAIDALEELRSILTAANKEGTLCLK